MSLSLIVNSVSSTACLKIELLVTKVILHTVLIWPVLYILTALTHGSLLA